MHAHPGIFSKKSTLNPAATFLGSGVQGGSGLDSEVAGVECAEQ